MAILHDTVEIKATPEQVFNTFMSVFSSEENYKKWHKDHVSFKWIKGKAFEEGSILYAEEYLHGKLHKLKTQLTKIEPYKKIEYRFLFPYSILCPKGSFLIEVKGNTSFFIANLTINAGSLLSKIVPKRLMTVKKHMKEEGENLKKLLIKQVNDFQ